MLYVTRIKHAWIEFLFGSTGIQTNLEVVVSKDFLIDVTGISCLPVFLVPVDTCMELGMTICVRLQPYTVTIPACCELSAETGYSCMLSVPLTWPFSHQNPCPKGSKSKAQTGCLWWEGCWQLTWADLFESQCKVHWDPQWIHRMSSPDSVTITGYQSVLQA